MNEGRIVINANPQPIAKGGHEGPWIGVAAPDRNALVAYLEDLSLKWPHEMKVVAQWIIFHVTCPGPDGVGWSYYDGRSIDVPHKSLPCRCGRDEHWLIKYDNE